MSSLESHATATAAASEPKWPDGACNGCGTIPKYYVDRELAKDEEYYVKHCLNPKDGPLCQPIISTSDPKGPNNVPETKGCTLCRMYNEKCVYGDEEFQPSHGKFHLYILMWEEKTKNNFDEESRTIPHRLNEYQYREFPKRSFLENFQPPQPPQPPPGK